jgi:hypothetical protein
MSGLQTSEPYQSSNETPAPTVWLSLVEALTVGGRGADIRLSGRPPPPWLSLRARAKRRGFCYCSTGKWVGQLQVALTVIETILVTAGGLRSQVRAINLEPET